MASSRYSDQELTVSLLQYFAQSVELPHYSALNKHQREFSLRGGEERSKKGGIVWREEGHFRGVLLLTMRRKERSS